MTNENDYKLLQDVIECRKQGVLWNDYLIHLGCFVTNSYIVGLYLKELCVNWTVIPFTTAISKIVSDLRLNLYGCWVYLYIRVLRRLEDGGMESKFLALCLTSLFHACSIQDTWTASSSMSEVPGASACNALKLNLVDSSASEFSPDSRQ